MSIPNTSERSTELDRQENITKGNLSAKRVAIFQYDADTDTLQSGLSERALATRIDDTSTANTTYIGKASIGASASASVWQIAKLDTSSGLIKTWADGDALFNNVWDDRTSLTYS